MQRKTIRTVPRKEVTCCCCLRVQRCELTNQVELRSPRQIQEVRSTTARESIHSTPLVTPATPPLPGVQLTELEQPALPVRVEEGVCQVVPIILGNFKGLVFNALIQVLEKTQLRC